MPTRHCKIPKQKITNKGDFKNHMTAKDKTSLTYNNQGNTVD